MGSIRLQSGDASGSGDDLTINNDVKVETLSGDIFLKAGDNFKLNRTAIVKTTGAIEIEGDYTDAKDPGDVGRGSTIDLIGSLIAQTIRVKTYGDDDVINVHGSGAAIAIDSGAGRDIINLGDNGKLSRIKGSVTIDGKDGIDDLNIDNNQDPSDSNLRVLKDRILGLTGITGDIFYQNIENIDIKLGGGKHTTQVATDITAKVNLNTTSSAANTLILDFSNQATPLNLTLDDGFLSGLQTGGSVNYANNYQTVRLSLTNGNDSFTVKDANFDYNLYVNAGTGRDVLNVDYSDSTIGYNALVQVTDNNVLGLGLDERFFYSSMDDINITLGNAADTVRLLNTSTANFAMNLGGGDDSLQLFDTLSKTKIDAGAGNDNVMIQRLSGATTLSLGSGDDTVTVGSAFQTLTGIQGTLDISGDAGQDIVTLDAAMDTVDRNARFDRNSLTNSRTTVTGLGAATITYDQAENLNLALGLGNDTVTIAADELDHYVALAAGEGRNQLALDFSTQTTGKKGLLNLTDTEVGGLNIEQQDFLSIDITLGSGRDQVDVINTYSGIANLKTGAGDDTVNVLDNQGFLGIETESGHDLVSIERTTATTLVSTGVGYDSVILGARQQTLENIQGRVIVEMGEGGDSLVLDATVDQVDREGMLNANMITGLGLGQGLQYSGADSLELYLGSGNDSLEIQSIAPNTYVKTGAGDDQVAIDHDANVGNQAGKWLNVETEAGNDTVNLKSTGFTYNLVVDTGEDQDKLNIQAQPSVAGEGSLLVTTETQVLGLGLDERFQHNQAEVVNLTLTDAPDTVVLFNEYSGEFNLNTGGGNDTLMILENTSVLHVETAAGDDTIRVQQTSEKAFLETGEGDDLVVVGNATQLVSGVHAPLLIDTGAGVDELMVDNAADEYDRTVNITPSTISGLGTVYPLRHEGVELLNVALGSGRNTVYTSDTSTSVLAPVPLPSTAPAEYHALDLEIDRDGQAQTSEAVLNLHLEGYIQEVLENGIQTELLSAEHAEIQSQGFLKRAWSKLIGRSLN
ncbi:MAG: hypothetical protein HC860_06235 [Alkalinema sp. RU_4_3]|nr:hypothetical protein [Alkalinema sp. RU_4_3]